MLYTHEDGSWIRRILEGDDEMRVVFLSEGIVALYARLAGSDL